MCGSLMVSKQPDSEDPGSAGQPFKDVCGVRTFRVCNYTDFFHNLIVATTGPGNKIYSGGNGHRK